MFTAWYTQNILTVCRLDSSRASVLLCNENAEFYSSATHFTQVAKERKGLCVYFHVAISLTALVSDRLSSMRIKSRLSEHVINPHAIVYVDQTFERQFVIAEFDSKYRQYGVGITNLDFTNKNIPSRH